MPNPNKPPSDPVPDDYIRQIKEAAEGKKDLEALSAMGETAVRLLKGEITILDDTATIELFRIGQGGPHGTTEGIPHIHWPSGQSPYTGHHTVKMRHSGRLHEEVESLEDIGMFFDRTGQQQSLDSPYFVVSEGDGRKAKQKINESLGPHYYIGKMMKALKSGCYKKAGGGVRFR